MKLTKQFKQWLVDECGTAADASDDDFRKAAGEAFATGKLSPEKYAELTEDPATRQASEFNAKLDQMIAGIGKMAEMLSPKKEEKTAEKKPVIYTEEDIKASGVILAKMDAPDLSKKVAAAGDDSPNVRVKGAWEMYGTTKTALMYPTTDKRGVPHPMAGRPVLDYSERGRPLDNPSELDRAVAGAWGQYLCSVAQCRGSRAMGWSQLPQHSKELLQHAMEKMRWGGASDGGDHADIVNRSLHPHEQKALIDDATSGGIEAAPIVFDDMVIETPLLYGELFPLVNVVPIDRGRRVEGVIVGTVTASWGGVDDTAIALFDTTAYVTAFDTTIFRWEGAIKIGLDFLSDTPIDFASIVTRQYGERLLEDLDDVIATGNGTTQPEGITVKAGVATVDFTGATSLDAYELLRFGVAKAEHRPNVAASAVFAGNETSYQRARALQVSGTDERRLFGMNYDSYAIMERPYKINESMANTDIFYAIMARYRMYRRRGLTIRTSTEGDTLIRDNELLIVAMARFGGQLERAAAAVKGTNVPA